MLACVCCVCAGKRCVELGSGAGLLGVALARLEVRELLLTDGDHTTLGNLRHNLRLNGVCEGDVRAPEVPLAPPVLMRHATSAGAFLSKAILCIRMCSGLCLARCVPRQQLFLS